MKKIHLKNVTTRVFLTQPPGLWDLGRTPINVSHKSIYLDKYPIRQVANEIFQGFTYGFMLNYQGPRIGVFSNNLLSADQLQAQLEDKICKEIREERVMGPFSHPQCQIFIFPL